MTAEREAAYKQLEGPAWTLIPPMADFFDAIEQLIGPVTSNHVNFRWHPHRGSSTETQDPAQPTFFREDAA